MKRCRAFLLCLASLAVVIPAFGQTSASQPKPAVGPNGVVVRSMFNGQIFGFDIDPNGNLGVLSEAKTLPGGKIMSAVETFDQATGEIVRVIIATEEKDDFVTLGVFNSVGLIEREHEVGFLRVRRKFRVMEPLDANKFTGGWAPPIDQKHLVHKVSGALGSSTAAVYVMDNSGGFKPLVFSSDIGANTFGPIVEITDQNFNSGADPGFAFDSQANRAVLGHALLGNPFVPGYIATVDLATGAFNKFRGVGLGDVNGLAVDPSTGTVCTTTEIDFSVQFYDLATESGFGFPLPNAFNQFNSGADVAFDPINKLFLVAQPNSSTAPTGSSIYVYDLQGNLIESLSGFSFSNAGNVVPAHIALHPSTRTGFVDGPDPGVREIQGFSY